MHVDRYIYILWSNIWHVMLSDHHFLHHTLKHLSILSISKVTVSQNEYTIYVFRSTLSLLTKSQFYPCYKAPANCASFENVSLTDKGILDVFPNEITAYCSSASGCAQHVLDVLKCIHLCKRDFWFANKANVSFLNQTIHDGCSNKTKSTYSFFIHLLLSIRQFRM